MEKLEKKWQSLLQVLQAADKPVLAPFLFTLILIPLLFIQY